MSDSQRVRCAKVVLRLLYILLLQEKQIRRLLFSVLSHPNPENCEHLETSVLTLLSKSREKTKKWINWVNLVKRLLLSA